MLHYTLFRALFPFSGENAKNKEKNTVSLKSIHLIYPMSDPSVPDSNYVQSKTNRSRMIFLRRV